MKCLLFFLFEILYHCIKVNSLKNPLHYDQVVDTFNFLQLPILIVLNHVIHTLEYKIMSKMKMSEVHTVRL